MRRARFAAWLATTLAAAATPAWPQQGASAPAPEQAASSPFSKQDWRVARGSCPIGCSEGTRQFLQTQVDGRVTLSPTRFAARWDEPCEGVLRYDVRAVPATAVVAEVNKGVAPSHRQMTSADLKLDPLAATTTAVALCRGAQGDSTQQRLLAVEPDRILVLYEEQAIIELR